EFEMELNILFGKAKILDSNAKWRCLMAALNPKYQKLILREKLADFEKAVELVREEANLYKLVDSHKYPSERQEQTLKASETVVVKDHGSGNQDMYEALTKKFEELSINLITKIEHATNLQYNKCRTDRESYDYRNKLFCYRCKRDCNRSWDCQDNRQFQIVRDEKKNQNITEHNSVGCIDLEEGCHEMLKPDSSEVNIVDKRSRDELTEDEVLRDKLRKTSESNEVVHLIARNPEKYTAVRKRNDFGIRMEDSIDRYSIKSDLTLNKPKINFAQLLQASPAIRTELLNLCKRVEVKNFNSIDNRSDNVTNCKAIVEIFGNYYWAIMDTGAACSVISEELLEELGLGPDFVNNQVIVTADGTKHATLGVMKNCRNKLILGTDWFVQHKAVIDLNKGEMALPVGEYDVILSISSNKKLEQKEVANYQEEFEFFALAKEENEHQVIDEIPEKIKLLLKEYEDLLVEDINQLTQTDVIEHGTDTGRSPAIKLRPYRMPHNTREAVRSELKNHVEQRNY
ncbi:hypothetical protein AYI69_g2468, partial [Smittium culicis]